MATGTVLGVEAPLRWVSPDMPVSTPDEFVPILEESCLIVPVGAWVLHEACNQLVAWQTAGLPKIRLSVNISAVQFQQGDLNETVRQVLKKTGLDPSLLCLEVTESMLMRDMVHARMRLKELRELGVSLSLDDFGTGYSSLAYLSELPVQELKVDRSFVQRLHETPSKTAVVNTIIAMAQELGLEIVAEGVETEEQKSHLVKRNCTTIQGFLFSRPLTSEQVVEFIHQWKS
jgi:EAL domain-containing protein (putative c-di-GMP-specific phosphodiesterase class I)